MYVYMVITTYSAHISLLKSKNFNIDDYIFFRGICIVLHCMYNTDTMYGSCLEGIVQDVASTASAYLH